jgi:dTDP-glucose pyrophosphorylase
MDSFKDCLISPQATVLQAVEAVQCGKHSIAIVVDEKQRLLGIVTDFDLRKAILKGDAGLSIPVSEIMNQSPVTAPVNMSRENLIKLHQEKRVTQIPLLDNNRRVVGLETFFHLMETSFLTNPVVIMAGGKGKRLRPLTYKLPKPLLPLGNRSVIETIIEGLKQYGFQNIIVSVKYKSELIKKHLGDGTKLGVRLSYVNEKKAMGTAGSLGLIKDQIKLPFLVVNGDVLTKVNFKNLLDFHIQEGNEITACVKKYDFQIPYGVVEANDLNIMKIVEKPWQSVFVNAGIYALNPSIFEFVPRGERLDMTILMNNVQRHGGKVGGFPISEYWIDIGNSTDFKKADQEFSAHFERGNL